MHFNILPAGTTQFTPKYLNTSSMHTIVKLNARIFNLRNIEQVTKYTATLFLVLSPHHCLVIALSRDTQSLRREPDQWVGNNGTCLNFDIFA